jgi:hypothetical protein
MNSNIDTSRKIERFLTGEMSPDEEQAFRREMENDTRLGREVALEKLMLGSMKRDAVRAPYNHADARSRAVASLLASRGDGGSGGGGASSGKSEEGQGGRRFWGLIGFVGVVVIGVTTWALYPTLIGGSSQTKEMTSPSVAPPSVVAPPVVVPHQPSAGSSSLQQDLGTGSEPARSDRGVSTLPPSTMPPSTAAPSDIRKDHVQGTRSSSSTSSRVNGPRAVPNHDQNVSEGDKPNEPPPTFHSREGKTSVDVDKQNNPKK